MRIARFTDDDERERADEKLNDPQRPQQVRIGQVEMLMREREHHRAQPFMRAGIRGSFALTKGRQLRLRPFQRDTRCQTAEHVELGPFQPVVLQRIRDERDPELMIHRKLETLRHDADHRVRSPTEIDRSRHNLRVTTEARLPRLIAR